MISPILSKVAKSQPLSGNEEAMLAEWADAAEVSTALVNSLMVGRSQITEISQISDNFGLILSGGVWYGDGNPQNATDSSASGFGMSSPGVLVGTSTFLSYGFQAGLAFYGISPTQFFIGSDVSAPATTSFAVFSAAQTYNSESMSAGAVLFGDNTSGKANMLWDPTTGYLRFRGGTTTQVYINTAGQLAFAKGYGMADAAGITFDQFNRAMKFTKVDYGGSTAYRRSTIILNEDAYRENGIVIQSFNVDSATNLITTNPGAESGSTTGWTASSDAIASTTYAYSGTYSFRLRASSIFGNNSLLSNKYAVTANLGYSVRAMIKAAGDPKSYVRISIWWYTSGDVFISESTAYGDSIYGAVINEWVPLQFGATAPATAAKAAIYMFANYGVYPGVLTVYIDDVELWQTSFGEFLISSDGVKTSGYLKSLGGTGLQVEGTTYLGSTVDIGHASDTTLSRSSAGVLAVEGNTIPMNGTSQVATFGTVELGHASDTTLSRSSAGVLAVEGVVIPSISSTNTLTNKRVTPRTGTTTSSATPTINTDNVDFYSLTAQTADITSFTTNLSGTPTDGQMLTISITGTAARAITWGTSFEASTVALPTTTVTTARLDVRFMWNAATSKWRCVGTA